MSGPVPTSLLSKNDSDHGAASMDPSKGELPSRPARDSPSKKWQLVQETRSGLEIPKKSEQIPRGEPCSRTKSSCQRVSPAPAPPQQSIAPLTSKSCSKESMSKGPVLKQAEPSEKNVEEGRKKEEGDSRKMGNWKSKGKSIVLFPNVAVVISLLIQLAVTVVVLAELICSSGTVLLFLVAFTVLLMVSLFFTLEMLASGTKNWAILSGLVAVVVAALAITALVVQTQKNLSKLDKNQIKEEKLVQRLAAVLIVAMVSHVLAVGHHLYTKKGKKQAKEEEKANPSTSKGESEKTVKSSDTKRTSSGVDPKKRQMAYMVEADFHAAV